MIKKPTIKSDSREATRVVQLPEGERPDIGRDAGPLELKLETTVGAEPGNAGIRFFCRGH